METLRLYRVIFIVGFVWNLLVALPLFCLVWYLPTMLGIGEPHYPIFIYYNLMEIALFGVLQLYVARHLESSRGIVAILAWSKLFTVLIFVGGLFFLSMPAGLVSFFAPGMVIDAIFGLLFWRFTVFSAHLGEAH